MYMPYIIGHICFDMFKLCPNMKFYETKSTCTRIVKVERTFLSAFFLVFFCLFIDFRFTVFDSQLRVILNS